MSSVLQGSGLCLRWRAGRDRDGSAVRQGPGRPLLCQSGPKQRLDRHSPPDLASALPLQALLQPTCLSYLPVCLTDTQSVVNCNTSTWPDSPAARLLGRFTPTTTWETMADVQVAMLKVWACSDTTALSLVGQYKAHITFTATTMRRRIKKKKKKKKSKLVNFHKMSRTQTSAGLLCVKLPYFTPELSLCLLHTNIDSVPKHRLVKLRQALCLQS